MVACLLARCTNEALRGDDVCREHADHFRRLKIEKCGCGVKLVGPYALERGTCFKCHEKSMEEEDVTITPRKAGVAFCDDCGKDMEGEHSRAKRCSPCRGVKPKKGRKQPQKPPEPKATPKPKETPPAEPAPVAASETGGNGAPPEDERPRSLLERVEKLEGQLRFGALEVPTEFFQRLRELEEGLASLEKRIFGERETA